MNLAPKIISPEERGAKRFRLAVFLSAFLIPTAGVYYKYKVQIDDLFKKTGDKVSEIAVDTKNSIAFSGDRGPVHYEKENAHRINLKDLKKEPEPFSYESAETDPNVMGDFEKMHGSQQEQYKKYLADKNIEESAPKRKIYRVKKGDNAQVIADGNRIRRLDLIKYNPQVEDWGNLKVGQKLNIIQTAGGTLAPTEPYSEKIPQTYANQKVNKTTKAKKTKKTKASSKKSKQMAGLQKEKKKTEDKKETLQAVIDQKNSKQAKENPKENQKQINQTIDQSNLSDKEKKAVKQKAKENDDKSLKEAKGVLEKKESVLETAIETNNPLYYYQWPREIFDFTYNSEQRTNAEFYYWLTVVNNGIGYYGDKNPERHNYEHQVEAVTYFLTSRSRNLFSPNFYFVFNGKKITAKNIYDELAEAKKEGIERSSRAFQAYRTHWADWVAHFGGEPSQSPTAPK